ncbi:unnamed protein product, partial [Didymodactylos carnosus]
MGVIAENHVSK